MVWIALWGCNDYELHHADEATRGLENEERPRAEVGTGGDPSEDGDTGGPPVDEPTDTGEEDPCSDATQELLVVPTGPTELALWVAGSGGTFPERVLLSVPEVTGTDLVLAQLDQDDNLEIAVRTVADGLVLLDADCAYEDGWAVRPLGRSLVPAGAADLDLDGDLDLYGFEDDRQSGTTLLNDGDGGFTVVEAAVATDLLDQGYVIRGPYHPADLDLDGLPDLVVGSYATMIDEHTQMYFAKGHGDGTFAMPVHKGEVPTPVNTLDVGDVDADGALDVVAGMDDDGNAGRVFRIDPASWSVDLWLDVTREVESGTDHPGAARGQLYDWERDGLPELTLSYQVEPNDVLQTIVLVGLDGGPEPVVTDHGDDMGTYPTLMLGVPIRP